MKLELGIMAGAESKAWLSDLSKIVDRLERAAGVLKTGNKAAPGETEEEEEQTTAAEPDEDDDFAAPTKKAAKKTAKGFDQEEEEADAPPAAEEEEDEGFTAAPAKKTAKKPKALTVDDVNDACKARAAATGGKKGRAEVLEILKKNFKTESVSELKPEQYAKCVALMAV